MLLPRLYPILDTESPGGARDPLETAAAAFLEAAPESCNCGIKGTGAASCSTPPREVARLCREAGVDLIDQRPRRYRPAAGRRPARGPGRSAAARRAPAHGPDAAPRLIPATTPSSSAPPPREPVDYRGVRSRLPHRIETQSRSGGGRGRVAPVPRADWTKPLVAIGGITRENAGDVFAAGADSVAVIGGPAARTLHRAILAGSGWKNGNNSRRSRARPGRRASGCWTPPPW